MNYSDAVAAISEKISIQPKVGLVLGSGLGTLADELDERVVIPYDQIPGMPTSTVHGHGGNLVVGTLEGQPVVVQQGRAHLYEGYTPQEVVFPVRVMHQLGIETLILTNAAGGVREDFEPGDMMIINDHIYLTGLAGLTPLTGPNDDSMGPRFLGMAQTYDRALRQLAHRVAKTHDETLKEGVYFCLTGPQFETPAEIRMIRMLGGDSVGMSTVHEVVAARHVGMRVLAFSSITNKAIDQIDTDEETSHEEVLDVGKVIVPKLARILRGVLREIDA